MRIDLACDVKVGDIIFNCFMEQLVVTSIYRDVANNSRFNKIIFSTVDTRLNKSTYDSNDVYLKNLDGESDEEKSWINWAKDNKDFFDTFDHIETMKEIYKIGFGNGYEHKRQFTYEEMMQK